MSSEPASDRKGNGETGITPSAGETIERHLHAALDDAENPETRFHLRQALQLVEALDDPGP
ncbi:hypothetical protein [Haloplanus pelagicus]|uniref:hypothetical protein n=1 Tax=Haloplanus pelagicus TaxID=2949995 RepID=UPI00203C7BAA|nr:hypothetical protein [Haloplanus sp. HW8-1]